MTPGSPAYDPPEVTRAEVASPSTSEQLCASAGDRQPEKHQEGLKQTAEPDITHASRVGDHINDGAILSEVRSCLNKISNGVEEVATTFQDFFGLSDTESNASDDYDYDSDGERKLSWAKLKSRARERRQLRRKLKNAPKDTKSRGDKSDTESDSGDSKRSREILPEVRECNFEQFQSRPFGDDHKLHCIDILIAGDSLKKDIERFEDTVAKIKSGKLEHWKPGDVPDRVGKVTPDEIDEKWIRDMRINSRVVIQMLRHVSPQAKGFRGGRSIVFHRPFQLLVSLHDTVKEQLAKSKTRAFAGSDDGSGPADSMPVDISIQKLFRQKDSLDQLTCFVDFMEKRIMPDSRRYRDPSGSRPKTIRYEDLCYLFRAGDLIYNNFTTWNQGRPRPGGSRQRILRVIQTNLNHNLEPGTSRPIGLPNMTAWGLLGHFIEHDGASYAPVQYLLNPIAPFDGAQKVTDLPFFPISYLEDDQIVSKALPDGSTYVNLIERRFGFYSGWTTTENPYGNRVRHEWLENKFPGPEYIESDILVDFQETFSAIPEWTPGFYAGRAEKVEKMDVDVFQLEQCALPLLEWDSAGQTRLDCFDRVLASDETELVEAKRFVKEDVLGQFSQDTRRAPTGIYLALLPRRFFAYTVLERKFVQLDTRFVRSTDLEANDKAFEKLEINKNYKRLILSLVKSHFDKIETEKTKNVEIETQDLIRGKGKGVVILLHGVPGVGKTATAEAVALKWKKPLFPITCGDLGYTAESLEKSLNEIFRLAHHWGCILLLDEADVFITQRERHDLKRNALVSAFLRVLEYYNGIMFLTTNRAGVLDEAIKSRVHLNLYYDHLTEEQTVAIFKQHVQRLRDIEKQRNPDPNEQIMVLHKEIIQFARDHYNQRDENHGSSSNFGRWNGRQIRNAFLIASSLTHYDSEEEGDDEDNDELDEPGRKKQKQLGRSHFEIVAQTTLMYDQYRASVHSGKSDEHVAFEREERAMSSQPRSPTPVRMKNISKSFS